MMASNKCWGAAASGSNKRQVSNKHQSLAATQSC